MTYDIEGWVEASRFPDLELDEQVWQGAIRIPTIIDCWDAFSEQFFGLSRAVAGDERKAPAGARGIPINAGYEVRSELRQIVDFEAVYGFGNFGGYTYATWQEVEAFLPRMTTAPDQDWTTLLAAAVTLANDPRFTAKGVRFVVWYNW